MNKAILLCFVSVSLGVVGMQMGCSDSGDEGDAADGAACFDYSGFDGTTPATTFRGDVLPLFQRSCGLSDTCHGNPTSPTDMLGHRPFLGPPMTVMASDEDIAAIRAANIDQTSVKGTPMKIIAPGQPEQSFLMHKMDGLCAADLPCEGVGPNTGCGETMPQKASLLAVEERNTVRRWIAQGAKDD